MVDGLVLSDAAFLGELGKGGFSIRGKGVGQAEANNGLETDEFSGLSIWFY